MKIAFLSWTFYPALGGTQVFLYKLIEELISKGYEVDIYLPSYAFKISKNYAPKGAKIIQLSFFEKYSLNYCSFFLKKKILQIQKNKKYDLWQVIGAYPPAYLCEYLKNICPIVLRTHGDDIQINQKLNYGFGRNKNIQKKIILGLHTANKLIALTNDVKNIYLENKINNNKIAIIPNGVTLNDNCENKELNNKRFFKFITVGRAHKKKGYDLIPATIKKLQEKKIHFIWTIIGEGVIDLPFLKEDSIKKNLKLIDRLQPEIKIGNLSFPPEALTKEYAKNDFFIMTSYIETFGMVLIEAMNNGLAVISSDAPGCREVIKHRYNGLIFKSGDIDDLTDQILTMIDDKKTHQNILSNSKKDVKQYSWDKVSNKYISLYKNLKI